MTKPLNLDVGTWILTESMMYDSIGLPRQVTKLAGSRVYWRLPRRHKDGSLDYYDEGYCALKSVRFTVPSEKAGIAAFNEQMRLRTVLFAEKAEALQKYRKSFNTFIQELKE